ncbi:glycoside hydrolase family 3 protein [Celerinatantimonas yamalensis]|uniref:beta-glucosidase n=1 Tax=Celerinatantimonas yamalensis TaxID=559956 RepID=A0ABW9G8B9_9GAMM
MRAFFLLGGLLLSPIALAVQQVPINSQAIPIIKVGTLEFRDLNRNGKLDPYEDWRLSANARAKDLVSRMTLTEKAGAMMHASAPSPKSVLGRGPNYDRVKVAKMIQTDHVTDMITRLDGDNPKRLAEQNNLLQKLAEETRLGIPITVSSDPRNAYHYSAHDDFDSAAAGAFSQWPEAPGFGAIDSAKIMRQAANIIRQEYRAVGITEALSPQADIASEPRWARINGTFGSSPKVVHDMVENYVAGMQNGINGLNRNSVVAVVKHWVGYGAAKDGWDSHNYYGRFADFQDDNLKQHIYPFTGAFAAHVAAIMPTYSILQGASIDGHKIQPTGVGFSHYMLTDLLRGKYHFNGMILSDWLITSTCNSTCKNGAPKGETVRPEDLGMSWGVGDLSVQQRFVKAVNAGVDQFGGVADPTPIVEAVKQGLLSQQSIDRAVTKVMQQKFALGLFDAPFVNPQKAQEVLSNKRHQQLANAAQARSLVLLKNSHQQLPLKSGTKVYLYHVSADVATQQGLIVVDTPEQADVAIMRIETPFSHPHPNFFFGARQHEGPLNYRADNKEYQKVLAISAKVPTIVTVYLDRPAILTQVAPHASALIGNFGVSDPVLLQSLLGKHHFSGKLPFALPSSMQAVQAQHSDRPNDSNNPLYPFGFGLTL